MLKKLLCSLAGAALLTSPISADIIETNEISTIQQYATNDSLILFNVTDTLYAPATTLANNQWRIYFTDRVNALVSDKESADRLINKVKNDIVNHIPKTTVEECTPHLIADLQNQKIPVLGITQKQMVTSYADNFGLITSNHLQSIGINLEQTLSYLNLKNDDSETSYSFAYGLIFTNKQPVGQAVVSFLDRLEHKPAKVIMVDNSRKSLENTEAALTSTDMKFEGFRYGRADAMKANFDPALGIIQFFAFTQKNQIISDEEAKQIKQANPDVDYSALLDNYILSISSL